jgi:hypothetical protein
MVTSYADEALCLGWMRSSARGVACWNGETPAGMWLRDACQAEAHGTTAVNTAVGRRMEPRLRLKTGEGCADYNSFVTLNAVHSSPPAELCQFCSQWLEIRELPRGLQHGRAALAAAPSSATISVIWD